MLKSFLGGRVLGRRFGDGAPVVLALHGWKRDHTDWSAALRGLEAIALDLPGFGASPEPEAPWGSSEYADLIRGLLEEHRTIRTVAAHSFGGRIALHLATWHNLDRLILSGVPLLKRASRARVPLGYRITRLGHRAGLIGDTGLEEAKHKWGSRDYREATGVMRDVLVKTVNESYESILPGIRCPVDMVWGANDLEVPVDVAERALELIPNASLTVSEGQDHISTLLEPTVLRPILMGRSQAQASTTMNR